MKSKCIVSCVLALMVMMYAAGVQGEDKIMVFCGAAFKQPMEEVIQSFKGKTGIDVNVTYGGVGTLISQIMLTKRGDLLVVPSWYIMEQAKSKGLLAPNQIETFAYVVPAINVQKGNPKGVKALNNLTSPSVRVALANPEIVFIGMLAAELVEKALNPDERRLLKKNVVTYPEEFNKLAMALMLKNVDAIIGFHYLSHWYPDKVDTVKLKAEEVQRIGAGQAGVITYSKKVSLAEKFKGFLVSGESQEIFAKYHYFATAQQAFKWIGAKKPIGGEHPASPDWYKN